MSSLFGVTADLAAVFDAFDELIESAMENGISREDAEAAWFDTLDGIEQEFDEKIENTGLHAKELNAKINAIKQEEKNLATRRKGLEHKLDIMKSYIKNCMTAAHRKKVDGIKASVSIRKNPESLLVENESALISLLEHNGRDDLLKYAKPELRKTEIKKLLKSGEQLEGCSLISTQSVQIQ